jgi:hypothetical protein
MSIFMALARMVGVLGEPPPMKLTRRLARYVGLPEPEGAELIAASAVAHLGFGAVTGMIYGALPFQRRHARSTGVAFGVMVWALSYAGWIPRFALMRPPSRDRSGRPSAMLAAHVVYGLTMANLLRWRAHAEHQEGDDATGIPLLPR